jgi:hypothetical protein
MENLFGFTYDSDTWTWFDMIWPWIGLVAAIIILILLFLTNIFRTDGEFSRWRDSKFLSWLAIPIYMIHEFEEYGMDFLGNFHAFPNALCRNLDLAGYPSCPIPHEFYLFVNIPLVWIFAILAAILCSKKILVGLGLYSVIISNGLAHLLVFFLKGGYNPGLFSAIVIFMPSFFWLCRVNFTGGKIQGRGIVVLVATGIILHAILIASLFAFVDKKINETLLDWIQIFNASTIILIPWLVGKGLYKDSGSVT